MAEADDWRRQVVANWRMRGGPPRILRWRVANPRPASILVAVLLGAFVGLVLFIPLSDIAGWIPGAVVVVVATAVTVGLHAWLRRDVQRTRDALAHWDELVDEGGPTAGGYDKDQVLLRGWERRGGPGRTHRWIADHPRTYVAVVAGLVAVPLTALAVEGFAEAQSLRDRLQPLIWIWFVVIAAIWTNRHASIVTTAADQWRAEASANDTPP